LLFFAPYVCLRARHTENISDWLLIYARTIDFDYVTNGPENSASTDYVDGIVFNYLFLDKYRL
jgi:hypothetical protein